MTTAMTTSTVPTMALTDGTKVFSETVRGLARPVSHLDKKWVERQRRRLISLGREATVVFRRDVGFGEYVVRIDD